MSVTDDIVRRLRLTPVLMKYDKMGYPQTDYEACKKYINNEGVKLMREAADEIERLRKESDEARHGDSVATATLQGVIEERTTLRAERDGARRRVCNDAIQHGRVYRRIGGETVRCETPQDVAEMMGWDCFRETTK